MGLSVLDLEFGGLYFMSKAIVGGEDREGWCSWKDKDNYCSVWLKLIQLR